MAIDTVIAIIAAVAAAGGAASSGYEAHAADVHAGQAKRDQQTAAEQAQSQIKQQQASAEAQQAGAVALARQRAVASILPSTYGGTLGAGSSGQSSFAGKTLLGT